MWKMLTCNLNDAIVEFLSTRIMTDYIGFFLFCFYHQAEFIAQGSNVTSCTIGHKSNRIAATGGEDKKVNIWTLNSKPICIMVTLLKNEDRIILNLIKSTFSDFFLKLGKYLTKKFHIIIIIKLKQLKIQLKIF